MRLVASGTWLAFALVLLAAAALTLRLGRLLGTGPLVTVLAATLVSTALLLLNPFVYVFGYLAAAPSLVAIVVMWALPLAALELHDSPRRGTALLVVAGVAVVLLAHLWQALAPVPLVALAAAVPARDLVRLKPLRRPDTAVLVRVAVVAVGVAVLSAPPMLGILHATGLAQAGAAGYIYTAPVGLTALGILSLVRLVPHRHDVGARLLLGTVVGVVALIGVFLRETRTLDLTQYYPAKGVWFLTVLIGPVLALAAVELAARLATATHAWTQRLGPAARVTRVAAVAAAVALYVGFVLPVQAVAGSAAYDAVRYGDARDASGLRYDVALAYGSRFLPARTVPVEVGVGPVLDPSTTLMVSKLISFQTGQPVTRGMPLDVCADVRRVAGSGPAVVLTSLDPSVLEPVMRRDGCGDVPVVRRPGPPRQLIVPLDPRQVAQGFSG
jgi:hypothetical protein